MRVGGNRFAPLRGVTPARRERGLRPLNRSQPNSTRRHTILLGAVYRASGTAGPVAPVTVREAPREAASDDRWVPSASFRPAGEPRCRAPGGTPSPGAADLEETRRGAEAHHSSPRDARRLTRARVPGHSRPAGRGVESSEPAEHHPVATLECGAQALEQSLQRLASDPAIEGRRLRRPGDEIGLYHRIPSPTRCGHAAFLTGLVCGEKEAAGGRRGRPCSNRWRRRECLCPESSPSGPRSWTSGPHS